MGPDDLAELATEIERRMSAYRWHPAIGPIELALDIAGTSPVNAGGLPLATWASVYVGARRYLSSAPNGVPQITRLVTASSSLLEAASSWATGDPQGAIAALTASRRALELDPVPMPPGSGTEAD